MNNIKLDLTNLLDEIIAGGKYSNLQLNYYFSTKGYNKKEKSFITNIIHTTLKNLIFIDYLIEKNASNIKKRKIKQLLRISVAQFLLNKESDYSGIVFEAVETAKIIIDQNPNPKSVLKHGNLEFNFFINEYKDEKKINFRLNLSRINNSNQ